MLRDGQPGPQGQWGLCMRAVIQLHAEGVTSGGVGMQTTSTHTLLSSDPGGSGQRHSPALLHLVTRASSGPGTLKTTLSTPSCPPGAPLLGAQVDPPLKATGLASSQSSAPLPLGDCPSQSRLDSASQPAAGEVAGGLALTPVTDSWAMQVLSLSPEPWTPPPQGPGWIPGWVGALSALAYRLTLAPGITRALCGGPGRSGGPDWAALSMEKGKQGEGSASGHFVPIGSPGVGLILCGPLEHGLGQIRGEEGKLISLREGPTHPALGLLERNGPSTTVAPPGSTCEVKSYGAQKVKGIGKGLYGVWSGGCPGGGSRAPELLSLTEMLRELVTGRLVPVLAAGSFELAESLAQAGTVPVAGTKEHQDQQQQEAEGQPCGQGAGCCG